MFHKFAKGMGLDDATVFDRVMVVALVPLTAVLIIGVYAVVIATAVHVIGGLF